MKKWLVAGIGVGTVVASAGIVGAQAPERGARPVSIELKRLGTYASGVFGESAAEIVAHDPIRQRLFVVNAAAGEVDVLDITDPTAPVKAGTLQTSDVFESGAANSVAVRGDLVAVAVGGIEDEDEGIQTKTDAGLVVFFDANSLDQIESVEVGALPDMVTFTPDGRHILVANEGEPNDAYTIDPEGSVSIIDVPSSGVPTVVRTAGFGDWNDDADELRSAGVRIFGPNASVAQDLEPEYIAVDQQSKTAYVVLQEANAYAVLDIRAGEFTDIIPFGLKDHSLPGNELDPSNQDGGIKIASWPVLGMYQPDAIDAYQVGGQTYLVTANEGDSRDYRGFSEEERFSAVAARCTSSVGFQRPAELGQLNITTATGDPCGGTPHAYGARSFSIWTADGEQVFDSGSDFEDITAGRYPLFFNASNSNNNFDNRSDDKGPEPEGVVLGKVAGRTYAFIGLERVGGIMVYDVTDPAGAFLVQYLNNRDFSKPVRSAGDLGPEGLAFVDGKDSPTGRPMLAVGNEVSGTTTLFDIALTTPGNGPRR